MRLTGRNRGRVLCEKCRNALGPVGNGEEGQVACTICGAVYEGAFFRVSERFISRGSAAVDVSGSEDAQCYFHPGKEAVEVCSECGRMMCALCDIEQSSGHICPSCINDRKRTDIDGRPRRSWAYLQMAWVLLLLGIVIPVLPTCGSLFFSIAGLRNKDYSCTLGRKISLGIAAFLAVPVMLVIPVSVMMENFL